VNIDRDGQWRETPRRCVVEVGTQRRTAMRYWLFAFALLSTPAFAQSGELTLSPEALFVDNGQQSAEIVLTYRPGPAATDMDTEVSISLDRFGWAETQVIPSPTPDYVNQCQVLAGKVRALVTSRNFANLPAGVPIPICRMRVRTHAHTSRGYSNIKVVNASEYGHGTSYPITTSNALVYVP
jgi:hypothetical protein